MNNIKLRNPATAGRGSIKSKPRQVLSKVGKVVEKKKEDFIINIQNSSALGIIFRWIFANKVSILLFFAVLFYAGRSYYMENEYLKQRNRNLIEEREAFLNRTKVLEGKVLELESSLLKSKELNDKVREASKSLTSEQKRQEILKLIQRIKNKRALDYDSDI